MKRRILTRLAQGLAATLVLVMGLLVGIVFTPNLLYANRTKTGFYTVYHQQEIPAGLEGHLAKAHALLTASELYRPEYHLDLCLNDGSTYPNLIHAIQGDAFAYGFAGKVVLQGDLNSEHNTVSLCGYAWNLEELLAHESTHCLQAKTLGLLHSNPIARYPMWKWEGYAEYIARRSSQGTLPGDLKHYQATLARPDHNGWIRFADSTGTVLPYYKAWLMVRLCIEKEHLTYRQVLEDGRSEEEVWARLASRP